MSFYPFLGEGSPTKTDYKKVGTLILTSLLEDPGGISPSMAPKPIPLKEVQLVACQVRAGDPERRLRSRPPKLALKRGELRLGLPGARDMESPRQEPSVLWFPLRGHHPERSFPT